MANDDIDALWARAEGWLRQHAPEALAALRGPEDRAKVDRFSARAGFFPPDYTASLLRHASSGEALIFGWQLIRVTQASSVQEQWAGGPFPATWWPFAEDGGGNALCLDMEPRSGPVGQVVHFDHEMGGRVVAPSFGAWFGTWVDALEAGHIGWHPEWRYLASVDELPDRETLPAAVAAVTPGLDGTQILRRFARDIVRRLVAGERTIELPGLGTILLSTRRGIPAGESVVRIPSFSTDGQLRAALSGEPGRPTRGRDGLVAVCAAIAGALVEGGAGRPLAWPGLGELEVTPGSSGGRASVRLRWYREVTEALNP